MYSTMDSNFPLPHTGQEYYIPLSILVMLDHPRSAPHVYVKPTADMEIVSSQRVSRVGRVNIDYLKNWSKVSDHETCAFSPILTIWKVDAKRSLTFVPIYMWYFSLMYK